jgi:hypothetical protein
MGDAGNTGEGSKLEYGELLQYTELSMGVVLIRE